MYIYIAAVMLALVALMVISACRMKPHVAESQVDDAPTADAAVDEADVSDAADVDAEDANGDIAE